MFFGVNLSIRRLFLALLVTKGVEAGNANARPNAKFANAPRQARDWQGTQMPRSGPGSGGGGEPGRSWIQLKHYVRIEPKKISPTK